jgi:hypothetical protein
MHFNGLYWQPSATGGGVRESLALESVTTDADGFGRLVDG